MKFVKRISMFFIYPMTMFSIGFVCNMTIQGYFYPGQMEKKQPAKQESALELTSLTREPVITADTIYQLQKYDMLTGEQKIIEEKLPDKYMGMNRNTFVKAMSEYETIPSLTDKEEGFRSAEVLSFSEQRVVVRKYYEYKTMPEGFYLFNENNMVVVYYGDRKTLYMHTNVCLEHLPEQLKLDIIQVKYMETEAELFAFLESYSS